MKPSIMKSLSVKSRHQRIPRNVHFLDANRRKAGAHQEDRQVQDSELARLKQVEGEHEYKDDWIDPDDWTTVKA